jgi:tRNA ligase
MDKLNLLIKSKKSGVRTTVYEGITSVICQDNLYKTGNLPVMARGLFTDPDGKIIIRGYDKFFNINEVPKTEWDYLEKNTEGPYFVVMKENGCMVFISSDGNGGLYVTSKHSFTSPHAEKAKYWLDIHLKEANKTRKELSLKLLELNSTIALELCSDDFEEHILAYDPENWGLYCHGLIKNIELFETFDPDFVKDFSNTFGFHEVSYVIRNTIPEVKEFCESREGQPIEGWVIRSGNMFAKYKYDKPYLVWREWREITKSYLKKGVLHNFGWRYPETEQYSEWVKKEIATNINLFDGFLHNHGIIKIREMYLKIQNEMSEQKEQIKEQIKETEKTLIIPVGAPGVGKSTICRILSGLLGANIVENDNLNKKTQDFTKCVVGALLYNSFVIADRNNHLIGQRMSLVESCKARFPDINIWILEWDIPSDKKKNAYNEYKQILYERVEHRGENHLTLTPKNEKYKEIIDSFLEKRTSLEIDFKKSLYNNTNVKVAHLYLRDSIEESIRIISNKFGIKEENMNLHIDKSLQYQIPVSTREVKYWGLSLSQEQRQILINSVIELDDNLFKKMTKITKHMHLTLAYSRQDLKDYWKLQDKQKWTLDVDSICYNDCVIAVSFKNDGLQIENINPHITIAMTQETSPFQSNNMLVNEHRKESLCLKIEAFGPIPYY